MSETSSIRLHAKDLWSKFGFMDGDIQGEHPDEAIACSEYDGLPDAVMTYLAPLCPGVEIHEWGSHHNPMRAADFNHAVNQCPAYLAEVYADVTFDQWAEIVRKMDKRTNDAHF